MNAAEFLDQVSCNTDNLEVLQRLRALALPDCHLTAGCLFQTIWNLKSGQEPGHGIKDFDIFYFDGEDMSAVAERETEDAVREALSDLGISVDVKNQARVHLWYGKKFGDGYPRLTDARDGIRRYLVRCTCVGIRVEDGDIYAPFGFAELEQGLLAINPVNARPASFKDKADSYRARWPFLTIIDPE